MTTADFAAAFAALYAAHQVADHWVQTQHQSNHKGLPDWRGRIACAAHVARYTLTAVVALAVVAAVTGWRPGLLPAVVGLAVSAVSHYAADRRTPLRRLADLLGKDPGWLERGGGLYALDQPWHVGWLFVAALLVAA
ncbi:transcriptional regulator [Micromonospora humida]|uniref:transcriptional regulator n=1 Tax=Micromonospora humida TaxID=2809018 RepID=UPI0036705961